MAGRSAFASTALSKALFLEPAFPRALSSLALLLVPPALALQSTPRADIPAALLLKAAP